MEKIKEIEHQIEKTKEKIKELEEKLKEINAANTAVEIGIYFRFEGEKFFAVNEDRIRKVKRQEGVDFLNLPKKEEFKKISRLLKEKKIETVPAAYLERKVVTEKEKIEKAKELIKKKEEKRKIEEERSRLKGKLADLERKLKRAKTREENRIKREFLESVGGLCTGCRENPVKDLKKVFPEKKIALCNECWKKPEYVGLFKEKLEIRDMINAFNLSFEEIKAVEKVSQLNAVKGFEIPLPSERIDLVERAVEEGKNLLFTKELLEQYLGWLGVKKSWIRELEKEGIIRPVGEIEIEIKRRTIPAKIWDLRLVKEKEELIKRFVEEKEKSIKINKALAREKISKRLKEIHSAVKEKKKEIEEIIRLQKTFDPFLEIAFYLYHLNHYAKTHKYRNYRSYIYRLKKEVLLKGYRENPGLFKVFFVERGDKVTYCESCREVAYWQWRDLGGFYGLGITFGEFLREWEKDPCPGCHVEKDYYSLIEFVIESPAARYSFHLPYPEVEKEFRKTELQKAEMEEEALFIRFGREVEKYEALIVPLKKAIKKVEEYLGR